MRFAGNIDVECQGSKLRRSEISVEPHSVNSTKPRRGGKPKLAADSLGRHSTNSVTAFLPASPSYTYDLNGNLLSDGTRNFAYDDENQLINVWVTNPWMSQFVYDGKLRCRIRREYTWQAGAWVQTNEVRYVYDGNLVIQERDINNLPLTTYTRGKDLSGSLQGAGGIGGLLAMSRPSVVNPQHYFYHADGNGNITALINGVQAIAAKYLYDPYGNLLSMSGPMAAANTYRFSSKEWHQNSGLTYYLYRYYDANLQRWPNRDPIREVGFATIRWASLVRPGIDVMNPYAFVNNSPIVGQDPEGLSLWSTCKKWCTGPGKDMAKDKIKDKIEDKLSDAMKEWLADKLGGSSAKEAKENCDKIKSGCMDHNDPTYAVKCQQCAAYQCAISATTVLAAQNCLTIKFTKCDGGEDP